MRPAGQAGQERKMKSIESGRITRSYTQRIEAPPERVFPLLCPVREGEWLDGWTDGMEMIHSASGLAEDGCVFRTRAADRPETLWMITRHDPAERVVEFVRFTFGLVATRLTIRVEAGADASSSVHITYTFTPVSAPGADFVREAHSVDKFRRDMVWWEESMNHWLRSGEILRRPSH
jgi:hypothetical protein